ncbi:hypothetical protein LOZ86_17560 [Pectobacterium parvum]|uniref:Tetratricopeptide repeat protein n=1 Tax=Pectobacterium parvum TaxID=2778550 RepID=A0AAP9IEX1_9GAMM|nr:MULTISPECIES: hypothetical protein [Pectobacterium]GKW41796.1 hypothetical protein PEC301879_16540 [Pectobacterium carotovorum subsp. carotovorum]KFX15318.1 hypothetical protein KP17_08210 [Pectobacterium parvum]KHS96406.1 hypothetical protein RC88_06905 [Pectobacterium parvum]QHQ23013.1 hypothetical protein GMX10_02215 [Pectobacterium parvum]UFK38690.1 hypothetical protein LOZ86_17560 [Pectobacterium parvum]
MKKLRWVIFLTLLSSFGVLADMQDELFSMRTTTKLEQVIEQYRPLAEKDLQALKIMGIAWHQLALDKKDKASEQAVEYLSRYCQSAPEDMLALAWLGSSYAMLARDSSAVYKKITYVNKGLGMLDKAVNATDDNYQVRVIRASVIYGLPDMFNRKKMAFNDYLYLTSHFSLTPDNQSEFYYKLGVLAEDVGNASSAVDFFKKSVSADGESKWANKSKGKL